MRRLPLLSPEQYSRVAFWALLLLMGIVMTGAGVRLTGSGLGCPDWPQCHGGVVPPLDTHAWIEFGNRALSGLVGIAAAAAGLLAFRRRPFRRDLAMVGMLLPIGVLGQAVLGGFTVRNHLAPGFVMSHYILSMLLLTASVTLLWRSRHEPGSRKRSSDRLLVWSIRALLPLGAVAIFLGTAATASGPHAGGAGTGDIIDRLEWRGDDTLSWVVSQHAKIAGLLGIVAVGVWLLVRRRGSRRALRSMTLLCGLLGVQGALGIIQYQLELPSEIVWIHVSLGGFIWISILFAVAAAGRLQPRRQTVPSPDDSPRARDPRRVAQPSAG
jgi:cytochrome c oxidase assembly protein subunit 15